MRRFTIGTASSLAALFATSALALADDVRVGKAAYGDWQTDAPGVTRKITVGDLDVPLETPSTANRSKVAPKPTDAALKTMPGFSVAAFVTDMGGARVIRVAPNGDIFLSRSRRILKDPTASPSFRAALIRSGSMLPEPKTSCAILIIPAT
jgi:hypothetical protein